MSSRLTWLKNENFIKAFWKILWDSSKCLELLKFYKLKFYKFAEKKIEFYHKSFKILSKKLSKSVDKFVEAFKKAFGAFKKAFKTLEKTLKVCHKSFQSFSKKLSKFVKKVFEFFQKSCQKSFFKHFQKAFKTFKNCWIWSQKL